MTDFLQSLLGSLVAGGGLIAAAIYIFKQSFERLLDKQVELFKSDLARDLEHLKSDLAKDLEAVKLTSAQGLEIVKSGHRIDEAAHDAKFRSLLEFRGKQLRDFYWPLYIGLQKDNVIWRRILDKRDSSNELRKKVGAVIERDVVLPNHAALVALIEENLYLAEADKELEGLLLAYIRHVSVYRAIRNAGEEMIFPLKLGEEWPHDLFPRIEERTLRLQADYDDMLRSQEAQADRDAIYSETMPTHKTKEAEQVGADQPATRSESKPKG
jgi:hypothetical protein